MVKKQDDKKSKTSKSEGLDKKFLTELYRQMLEVRRFEEKAGQLYGMGLIGGFCHLYIGQEAVVIGMQSVIEKGDQVVTSYRDHGHIIASGIDPKYVMAELTGRSTGCSKGKGGSMHLFNTPGHFYGGHGIVAAQVPVGTGLAFANKYRKNKNISYTYLGDGAVNQGQVYESFNMAKLWNLPAVYIIENNQYAMGTSVKRAASTPELFRRGESFGIPGRQVDGMDVLAVREAGLEAAEYVRSGKGPIILEMNTYRYRGHSMSDPAKYRTKDEVDEFKGHDPIENLKQVIIKNKFGTEESLKEIDKKVRDEIKEVEKFSKESPEPNETELFTDIYNEA